MWLLSPHASLFKRFGAYFFKLHFVVPPLHLILIKKTGYCIITARLFTPSKGRVLAPGTGFEYFLSFPCPEIDQPQWPPRTQCLSALPFPWPRPPALLRQNQTAPGIKGKAVDKTTALRLVNIVDTGKQPGSAAAMIHSPIELM